VSSSIFITTDKIFLLCPKVRILQIFEKKKIINNNCTSFLYNNVKIVQLLINIDPKEKKSSDCSFAQFRI
jgi:hypothetical protein